MKRKAMLLATALLLGCTQQPGTGQDQAPSQAADPKPVAAPDPPTTTRTQTPDTAGTPTGVGTIQAVDAAAGTVTIAHGAISAVNWPAMTMTFKATPAQLATVKTGEKVKFTFLTQGMDATITSMSQVR